MAWPKRYTRAVRLAKLHDELIAAGLPPLYISGPMDGSAVELTYPPEQAAAPVDAVVAAHNAATPSTAEQQEQADTLTLDDLRNQYQMMRAKLDDIQADMAAARAHRTALANRAATLSTITVSGTLAQTQATIQSTLRALGTDLGTIVGDLDTVEADLNAISIGLERHLDTLRVFVRRQAG